ncbi:MAG: phosphatase [Lachnospiraceae bacterium]|nr:phosphatase [Lachnospiraceae bacterium]
MMREYTVDTHTHTIASGHAYNTILEMAKAAADKGIKILGITDHSKAMPEASGDFYFMNLKSMDREAYGVELLLGVELNIIDYNGKVDLPLRYIKEMDIVIASLHTPCIKPGTKEENTNALIKCCENPYIDIIGHPDDGNYDIDMEQLVLAAKRTGTLLELNNNSIVFRMNARENDKKMLILCKEHNVPIVIGSDAHAVGKVGEKSNALELVEEVDFPEELIMNYYPDKLKEYLLKN